MAISLNNCQFIGVVGNINSFSSNGKEYSSVSIALNKYRKKDNGEFEKEPTTWVSLFLNAELTKNVKSNLDKGDKIYAQGELTFSEYLDKSNTKHLKTSVNCRQIIMLERKNKQTQSGPDEYSNNQNLSGLEFNEEAPF